MEFNWELLGEYAIGRNWIFTPPTEDNLFKFRFERVSVGSKLWVAQYELLDEEYYIYGGSNYLCDANFILSIPPLLNSSRGLALKLLAGKTLPTEISSMPLNNPGSVNNVSPFSSGAGSSVALTANTSATVLAADPNRTYALFTNNGAVDFWLNFGPTATVGSGTVVKAGGGSFEINSSNLYTGVVSGIAANAASVSILRST